MRGQSGPQPALDHVDLADAVELVAGQVEQDDDRRLDRVGHVRDVHFVDLENRQRGAAVGGQRGHQARVHVGAFGVGGHRPPSVRRAAAVIRVVVDLPLVPVTTTVRRPVPSWRRSERSRVIATRPPIMAPAPRPVTRDAHRAPAPAARASRPRAVITREV